MEDYVNFRKRYSNMDLFKAEPSFFDLFEGHKATYLQPIPTIIKWAGSKSRLLEKIYPFLKGAKNFTDDNFYIEPFAGSLSVALSIRKKKMILNDKNLKLINFFEQVRDKPEKLVKKINKIISDSEKYTNKADFYHEIRNLYNNLILSKGNAITVAAIFWYLNKTGFNGMYRETSKGKFNTSFGKRICPTPNFKLFMDVSCALKNVILLHKPFEPVCSMAEKNDIVYIDPPYLPVSRTSSFSSYLRYGFGIENHKRLCLKMKEMNDLGVYVVMSNSFGKMTEEIYSCLKESGFMFHEIEAMRVISGDKKGRGKIKELIITNIETQ